MRPADSCAELLLRVEPHLGTALVGPDARRRLHALAARLPAGLPASLWLECRLAAGSEQVDLSLRISAGRVSLLGDPASAAARGAGADGPGDPVGALARRWVAAGSALRRGATCLWLEHDLPPLAAGGGAAGAPGVFVQLAPPRPGAPPAAVGAALAPLLGRAAADALRAPLDRCFRSAPAGARALQLGVMLSRGEGSVRLCFVLPGPGAIPSFLRTVGWPGRLRELTAPLRLLRPRGGALGEPPVMVQLDVGRAGVLPSLGIDYHLESRPQLGGAIAEQALLDGLVAAELADPAKLRALGAWPGARRVALTPGGAPCVLVRRVGHLKLACRPGSAPEVKAYLVFFAAPLRPARREGEPAASRRT